MSKDYPRFFVTLIGEPDDVAEAAEKLSRSGGDIEDAALTAGEVPSAHLAGPTGERAFALVGGLRFRVDNISGALKNSASTLITWAATINSYRKEFDRVHPEQDHLYNELQVAEPRLNVLRAKGDKEDYDELSRLSQYVGELKRNIEINHAWAQKKRDEYVDEAEKVGSSLYDDAFQSPAVSSSERLVRKLLGISDGLGTVLDVGGWAGLLLGGVGALGTKAVSRGAKETLDRINDVVEKALLAGASGKITADAVAAAAGADVNLGEIVFDALNLKGIGHLAKLKDDALDNLNLPDDTKDFLYEAIDKAQDKLKEPAFPDRKPVSPDVPPEERWQGNPPDRSNYA